jgi:ABC-type amino acid transport substrate-binding protein
LRERFKIMKGSLIGRLVVVFAAVVFQFPAQARSVENIEPPPQNCPAQDGVLRVTVGRTAPMGYWDERTQSFAGYDVEVARFIAKELGCRQVSFSQLPGGPFQIPQVFSSVMNGESHLLLGGLSITQERERYVDFVPYLSTGLGIAVRDEDPDTFRLFIKLMTIVGVVAFGGVLVIQGLLAVVLFVFDGKDDYPRTPRGAFAAWWAAFSIISTLGTKEPKTTIARVIAIPLFVKGAVFLGLLTAGLGAAITGTLLGQDGHNPYPDEASLVGKTVATREGTIAHDKLTEIGARVRPVLTVEEALTLLNEGKVDAVAFDRIALLATVRKFEDLKVLPTTLARHNYGVVLAEGQERLYENVTAAVLELQDQDDQATMMLRHFGAEP